MVKRNELMWCPSNMLFKLFLFSFLLQYSLGFDISDDGKRIMPLSHIGKERLLAALEDKSLTGGLIAYPRLGRHVWELEKALFPYSGAGGILVDPSSLDYDVFLNTDDVNSSGLEDSLTDAFLRSEPVVQKRRNVKLIPRIGRKKRSISEGADKKETGSVRNGEEARESVLSQTHWNNLDSLGDDYYFRQDDPTYEHNKRYVPGLGKKRSDYENELEEKRAVAFTPRIGRASLIPRIGRNDPRLRLKGRAAFVPRIGRRAAFIPRIGRSGNQRPIKDGAD